jgi:hypothetical protein
MVEGEPEFPEIWEGWLKSILQDKVIVAHNAGFDISVLRLLFQQYQIESPTFDYACTVQLSKALWPELSCHGLEDMASHIGIDAAKHHDAAWDAEACAQIALKICNEVSTSDLPAACTNMGLHVGQFWNGGWKSSGKTGKVNTWKAPGKCKDKPTPAKHKREIKLNPALVGEFSGIIKGILADGRVVLSEATYLADWLKEPENLNNSGVSRQFVDMLNNFIEDGILDSQEESALKRLLTKAV